MTRWLSAAASAVPSWPADWRRPGGRSWCSNAAAAADEVYLAAGSLGTTEILLRSRDLFRTLDRVSDRLGRGWSANGDFLAFAIHSRRPVSPTRGPRVSCADSFLDGSADGPEFFLEDGGFPDLMGNVLREVATRNPLLSSIFATFGTLPKEHVPMHRVMPWFCQGIDASDGSLSLKRRSPQWPNAWRHTALPREDASAQRQSGGTAGARDAARLSAACAG